MIEKCWDSLLKEAAGGATVAITGVLNSSAHWQSWQRSKHLGWTTETAVVSPAESITIDKPYITRYEGEELQRIEKAVIVGDGAGKSLFVRDYGRGKIVWSPLPLELGDSWAALNAFYTLALRQARVTRIFSASPDSPAVLVLPSVFREVVLYTFVSEAANDTTMQVKHHETGSTFSVNVGAGRTAMVMVDRKSGKVIR
jgi:hypothetical protein